jgi:hypothetical protein
MENLKKDKVIMGYIAGMILSGVAAGATSAVVGRYAAKRRYEAMSKKKHSKPS